MTTQITLTYCGMDGTGDGIRAAKQDAARKIEKLIDDLGHGPRMVHVGESLGVVYRDAHGWCYQIAGGIYASDCRHSGHADRDEATLRCASHIAQIIWQHDVADDAAFFAECLAELPGKVRDRAVSDLVSYAAWQRRYRMHKAAGMTDNQAHEVASGLHRT